MRQRDALRPLFRSAWDNLAARFEADELEGWAAGVLALADVNAGPSCLVAFWEISRNQPTEEGIAPLIVAAHTAANICRHAGAQAAAATIVSVAVARRMLGTGAGLARWWRTMDELALRAPESVEATASRMGEILSAGNINAFESFVAAGLKLAAGDRRKRLAFFTLQDELARRLIERASAGIGFAETERQTKAFVTSLWGRPPLLRSFSGDTGQAPTTPRRNRGAADPSARDLSRRAGQRRLRAVQSGGSACPGASRVRRAAISRRHPEAAADRARHPDRGCAHRVAGDAPAAGVAQAMVALSCRRAGRRRHRPHFAGAAGARPVRSRHTGTTTALSPRGAAMFEARLPRLEDPAISREVGMLLGNDLGQMRVQFNAKTYVVEPVYRDDGLGLWDFGDDAPSSGEALDLAVDAARIEQRDDPDQTSLHPDALARTKARSVARGRSRRTSAAS